MKNIKKQPDTKQGRKRKPIEVGISKKEFHRILEKAAQLVKKPGKPGE